ncbi:MAG: thymidylate synthase [Aestuariivita sp.]|nr:thymidylate synthase [Aestuariivita sp.]
MFFDDTFTEESADAAFRRVLDEILKAPGVRKVGTGAETVSDSDFFERLAFRFEISNPRHRIVANDEYKLNLPVAVARFVWMISGNNRLADIAFYEPRVRNFTDDGIIVPGSSYGTRIRQAYPGTDQLKGVIDELRNERNSRRAAISIYQPTDAGRESKDIPCAFGMFFHIRNNLLHTQVIMRSNNATALLPFNVFEFSLLAEVVAAECQVEMGSLSHYAASMHIYDKAKNFSEKILADGGTTQSVAMPPMPSEIAPLEEVKELVHFEADMRHRSEAISDDTIEDEINGIRETLSTYWQQLAFLLLANLVTKERSKCTNKSAQALSAALNPDLAKLIKWPITKIDDAVSPSNLLILDTLQRPDNIVTFSRTKTGGSFRKQAVAYEKASDDRLSAAEILEIQAEFETRLAARGLDFEVSESDFKSVLSKVRKKK